MAIYYVKNSGNDSLDGFSNSNAWATISKVNGFSFVAGDIVSFNKGDTWREILTIPRAGTVGAYMVYNAYGAGSNPRILGSNTTTWSDQGGNIWKSDQIFTDPYGGTYYAEVFFENIGGTKTWGVHVANTGLLNAEFKWTWASNYVYVYAVSDPDTRYTSVEIPQRSYVVALNSKNYLQFNGIDIHYSIMAGYVFGGWPQVSQTGLIIENSTIGYIGIKNSENAYGIDAGYSDMTVRHCDISNCGRRGISFHLYGLGWTQTNVLVEDNYFHDGWHTTGPDLSVGSSAYYTASIDGMTIRRNRFYDPPTTTAFSEFIFIQNSNGGVAGATINNVYIYSNIFINSSNGGIHMETANGIYIYNNTFYNHNTVSIENTFHLNISKVSPGYCTNITIKNNIFYTPSTYSSSGGCPIFVKSGAIVDYAAVDADYNIYYRYNNSVRVIEFESIHNYLMTELATLRSTTGWETHGQFASAAMTDPANQDFTLTYNSPAIGAGVDLGIEFDYGGNPYHLTTPSMGAYESFSTYYVKNDGNDSLSGINDANAWATIAKVNSPGFSYSAGDSILFNKGDVWRETLEVPNSGTLGNYIYFGNYGTGVNPRILGSKATTTWTDQGGNIWKTDITFTNPRSIYPNSEDIIFINSAELSTWGAYKASTGACVAQYDWTWSANYIYVYSTIDPEIAYDGIEVAQRSFCISTNDNPYLHFDGIDAFYAGQAAYDSNNDHTISDQHGIIIENANIGWIGGVTGNQYGNGISMSYSDMTIRHCEMHHCGRRSISVNMEYTASPYTVHDILIEDNVFHHGSHTSSLDITVNNGGTSSSINGVIFRRNLIYEDPSASYGYTDNQLWCQQYHLGRTGSITNFYIYSNIFKYNRGYGVGIEGLSDVRIYNNTFYQNNTSSSAAFFVYVDTDPVYADIRNNIFYTTLSNDTGGGGSGVTTYNIIDSHVTSDYNLYYRINNSLRIMFITSTSYYMNSLFPITEGYETNGLKANPLFISSTDLHLQEGSPAIGAGVDFGIELDFDGNAFDSSTPSIGAYEYGSNPPTTTTTSPTTTSGELTLTIGLTPIIDIKVGSIQITKVIRNGITYWQV